MDKVNDEEDFGECDDVFLGDCGDLGDEDKTKENILESLRKAAKNNSASKLKLTPDQWKGIPTNRSVVNCHRANIIRTQMI